MILSYLSTMEYHEFFIIGHDTHPQTNAWYHGVHYYSIPCIVNFYDRIPFMEYHEFSIIGYGIQC